MQRTCLALALFGSAALAACGGSNGDGAGNQALRTSFTRQVSFGDNLSDVGTYAVGAVQALGGGRYTINGDSGALYPALTGKNWTELMAAQFGLAPPCPAQTGLDGDPGKGFSVPVTNFPDCYSYAQGGARVTNPVGPQHRLTGSPLGQLTVPVATQVARHLAKTGGRFSGTEVVFVNAGANDVLALLGQLNAGAAAAGQAALAAEGPAAGARAAAAYAAAQGPAMVAAMAAAGAELAALVTTQIVARGGNYVVVSNLPDLGSSPAARSQDANTQALINAMIGAFNGQLQPGVSGQSKVLYVDLFGVSRDQVVNPAPYGLANTSTPACGPNALQGSALVCKAGNLAGGDVSRYMFADDLHPTPFEHALIAKYVAGQMIIKGWL